MPSTNVRVTRHHYGCVGFFVVNLHGLCKDTFSTKRIIREKVVDNMQSEDFRGLAPMFYSHVNPYGKLSLNMDERLMI
jgi:hypothetical protein